MSRIGRGPGAARRWGVAAAVAVAFAAAPGVAARLPLGSPDVAPRTLLARIVASERVPYAGYAESVSAIGLPDVPEVGRLVDLLGETSRLRVWYAAPDRWRVDALTRTGFGVVAVVALPDHLAHRVRGRLGPPFAAVVDGPFGEATVVTTPLLNGVLILHGGLGYAVSGTVPVDTLLAVATDLARA